MCPRSTLEKKDEHCLAKLSIINDNIYVVCIESTTMNLEARAGIWGHTICVSPTPFNVLFYLNIPLNLLQLRLKT